MVLNPTIHSEVNEEVMKDIRHLDELWTKPLNIILCGLPPETIGQKFTFRHALTYFLLTAFLGMYGVYDIVQSVLLSDDMIKRLSHACTDLYLFSYNVQWLIMIFKSQTLYKFDIRIEEFNSTKMVQSFAQKEIKRIVNIFAKVIKGISIALTLDTALFLVGPLLEAAISYFSGIGVREIYVLEPITELPWSYQIILYMSNSISVIQMTVFCLVGFTVLTIHVIKISLQCKILCEAIQTDKELSNMNAYIEDHIKIIRNGKQLCGVLESVVSQMFFCLNVGLAMNLYFMSLSSPSESMFFSSMIDVMVSTAYLAGICAIGSFITDSLESISNAIYSTSWYQKGKSYGQNVFIIGEIARRPQVPTVWFGTLPIQNPTVNVILQRSYSYFTLLTVLQNSG